MHANELNWYEKLRAFLRYSSRYSLKHLSSHVESVRASDLFRNKLACWLNKQPSPKRRPYPRPKCP